MQLNVPPDLEAMLEKRLATGAYSNAEDVLRRALQTLEMEESWSDEERGALDEKIDRALEQVAAGQVYGPGEARQKLAALKEAHLAKKISRQTLDQFQLTQDAVFDIEAIWLHLLEKEGMESADRIVTELFESIYNVADIPGIGHRRPDLTRKKVFSTECSPTC